MEQQQHTFYVVVNDAGKFLMFDYYATPQWRYTFGITHANPFENKATAESYAGEYGGKVKRVTVTVEED